MTEKTNEITTENKPTPTVNKSLPEKKPNMESEKLKVKKAIPTVKIPEKTNRQLPKLIQSVLEKNFLVLMSASGYYIEGFYGLQNGEAPLGYIYCQETTESDTLLFIDAKGHKHYVKSFEELVSLNSIVWGQFFKQSEFKKPNAKWFGFMLELGALNITPK